MTTLIITFGLFSPWLIWTCFLFYYIMKFDKSFNYINFNTVHLLKYWIYSLSILLFVSYVFILRLNNINRSINMYEIAERLSDFLYSLHLIEIIIIFLLLILLFVLIFLIFKLIYLHFRKCLLALFLYYSQYEFFRNCCSKYIYFYSDITLYLSRRVRIFTSKESILRVGRYIWPGFLNFVEPKIFSFILPYLFLFDFIVYDGNINKIFIVLPWYYLYMLVRLSRGFLIEIFIPENTEFSLSIYKSITFNGKIIRW